MEGESERFGEALTAGVLESPAAERNKRPILEVLRRALPSAGVVLEVASGTGQHVRYFAAELPELIWQPTDPDPELLAAIRARVVAAARDNLLPPLALDVRHTPWPIARADAILCINMIHIAPWEATQALIAQAGRMLAGGVPLILYGPYRRGGVHTAPSNATFDASLRRRNPEWGIRDLGEVTELAAQAGFEPGEIVEMPANNLTVVLVKT